MLLMCLSKFFSMDFTVYDGKCCANHRGKKKDFKPLHWQDSTVKERAKNSG